MRVQTNRTTKTTIFDAQHYDDAAWQAPTPPHFALSMMIDERGPNGFTLGLGLAYPPPLLPGFPPWV